jgi:drug/metabolite transporter (DMT)-like permease
MGPGEWGLLGLLSLLWGGSFLFMAVAGQSVPTLTIVAVRVGLAAVVLWLVVTLTRRRLRRDRAALAAYLGMGLLNNAIPFTLLVIAQKHIDAGLAAILNATTPLFAVLIAAVALPDEPLRLNRLAGVLIGLGGVAAMMGIDAALGAGGPLWAQLAVLAAAVSFALSAVFGRRFARLGIDPVCTSTGMVTAASLMIMPLTLVVDRPWTLPPPPPEALASMLALAIASTGVAYLIYFRILERAGAGNISLVTLLVPLSALALGALVLGERLGPAQGLGLGLIALGLAMQGRARLAFPPRRH